MKNNDLKTTLLGGGAGALILSTVDPSKIATVDRGELIKVGLSVLLTLLGYFTNKTKPA